MPAPLNDARLQLRAPGTRLDRALLDELARRGTPVSRARLKELFAEGAIALDGRPARAAMVLGEREHEVRLKGPLEPEAARASERGSFVPVIYEDAELLVLHKPSGVPSGPLRPEDTVTAVSSALARCPSLIELASVSWKPLEPGLLHRLDTGTSGLLCFAKTAAEFKRLRAAWPSGAVKKTYRAIVSAPENFHFPGRIGWPLAHDEHAKKRMIALSTGEKRRIRGNPLQAITHVLSTERRASRIYEVTVGIETGVMHQIRCHLSNLGAPILGDPIYGGKISDRLWLHAWRLEIPLANGARLVLEAELPAAWLRR